MHTKGSRSLEYCKYQQIPTMLHDVVVRLFVIPHTRPRSERESERQRARNGASESVRVFPWASNNTYQRSKRNIERHMIFFHLVLWKNHADVYPIILPFIWLLGYRHKGCFQLQGSSRTLVGHQLLCADSINYALCTIIMGIFSTVWNVYTLNWLCLYITDVMWRWWNFFEFAILCHVSTQHLCIGTIETWPEAQLS